MANIRVHLDISGRVQGVYFRYSMKEEAGGLQLTGWVRNLPNGKVEAIVEGPEDRVEQLISWCYHGPPGARVDQVKELRGAYRGEFTWFDITY